MSAALIPARLVPVARTDADWAFDIAFPEEDWTAADEVRVAFARQGLPAVRFEVLAAASAEVACAIRLSADELSERAPGRYTVEVRRIAGDETDDAAVFELVLVQGLSDAADRQAPSPIGDATTVSGGVIVTRTSKIEVVRAGGITGPPGPNAADLIGFDDALTAMGVETVQEAIAFLAGQQGFGPGTLNFSNPANAGLIGVI